MRKFVLLAVVIIISFLLAKNLQSNGVSQNTLSYLASIPAPTLIPFRELTIPYLREQKYESKLATLSQSHETSNYTAYLTSYISDGYTINGLLTQPKGEEPQGGWPAIVFVHGYIAPTVYQTNGEAYSDYVDYLARSGFVVFKIDLRGHGNSEGEPNGAYYSSDYIIDTLNAYAALQSSDFVNPNKIGLWGHSMAGNVVMRSFATKPSIPAVVVWAGAVYTYTDFREFGIQDSSYRPPQTTTQRINRRQQLFEKHGSPSASVEFWQQVAPVTYLNDLKGAIQIHHAVDDDVVSIAYSRRLNTLLANTKIPYQFYEYSSGGHNINGSNFTIAMQRTVDFFKKYLQ